MIACIAAHEIVTQVVLKAKCVETEREQVTRYDFSSAQGNLYGSTAQEALARLQQVLIKASSDASRDGMHL
jgi:hypothetical protein